MATVRTNASQDAVKAWAESGEIVMHRLDHMTASLGRHAAASVDDLILAQAEMLAARDGGEAARIYLRWFRGSVEATAGELTRLAELALTLPAEAAAPCAGMWGRVGRTGSGHS